MVKLKLATDRGNMLKLKLMLFAGAAMFAALFVLDSACAYARLPPPRGFRHTPLDTRIRGLHSFSTMASYYGSGERLNSYTASGERFRADGLTCAHRTLPLGTRLRVSHGSQSVVVRVNDRGPAVWTGRSLDLARGAASALGMIGAGVARVHVVRLN